VRCHGVEEARHAGVGIRLRVAIGREEEDGAAAGGATAGGEESICARAGAADEVEIGAACEMVGGEGRGRGGVEISIGVGVIVVRLERRGGEILGDGFKGVLGFGEGIGGGRFP